MSFQEYQVQVTSSDEGGRVDALVSRSVPLLSRSQVQRLIKEQLVLVRGKPVKGSFKPRSGDTVRVLVPEAKPPGVRPQDIPLAVLFEDEDLIVLNKPPGLVVHPSPGHDDGTLVNALLHHVRDLSGIGGVLRPGIVHRLDKDTSGVLLVAKNDRMHQELAGSFKQGRINKTYLALVKGTPRSPEGAIDKPIGRHPVHRKKMSVRDRAGKPAQTRYRVLRSFRAIPVSYVRVRLLTGRTHQIRVHMSALGHPVVGDPTYGGGRDVENRINRHEKLVHRQLLHASAIEWTDTRTGKRRSFQAEVPEDMKRVLEHLSELDADLEGMNG